MTKEDAELLIAYIKSRDIYSLLVTYPELEQLIRDFVTLKKQEQRDDLLSRLSQRIYVLEEKVANLYDNG